VISTALWNPNPTEPTTIAMLRAYLWMYLNRRVLVDVSTVEPFYHIPEYRYPYTILVSDATGTIGLRWTVRCPLMLWGPDVIPAVLRLGWVTDMDGKLVQPVFYLEAPHLEPPSKC